MSRFSDCDYDGEGIPPQLWWRAVLNTLRGRRGQAVLWELKEALLSLPQPRLITGAVVREGEVCALGALAAHRLTKGPISTKGYLGRATVRTLKELEDELGSSLEDELGTVEFGQAMGLVRALAWAISYENDEGTWKEETPEERYRRVLAWVEEQIAAVAR